MNISMRDFFINYVFPHFENSGYIGHIYSNYNHDLKVEFSLDNFNLMHSFECSYIHIYIENGNPDFHDNTRIQMFLSNEQLDSYSTLGTDWEIKQKTVIDFFTRIVKINNFLS